MSINQDVSPAVVGRHRDSSGLVSAPRTSQRKRPALSINQDVSPVVVGQRRDSSGLVSVPRTSPRRRLGLPTTAEVGSGSHIKQFLLPHSIFNSAFIGYRLNNNEVDKGTAKLSKLCTWTNYIPEY